MTDKKRGRRYTWVPKHRRRRLVKMLINKADEHMKSAARNFADGDLSTGVNRLYNVVERATVALMIGVDGQQSRDHGYIPSAFDDFCDRNLLPRSHFRGWLARL